MCQDFRASPAQAARVRGVTRPGITFVRRPPPPPAFFESARRRLGNDGVITDPAELIPYEIDAGQDRATPDGVVFPRSREDVVEIVRLANQHGVVLVPRAAGTSLSGGSITAVGGVVVAVSRMARVQKVDPVARQVTVDPCVINLELQGHLAPERLFYPPDPASQRASTIAGNIAENAGGPHCFKYGVTTSYVQALDIVLPSGEAARAGGPAVDYPEYDFVGLLTGSEGTLGITTDATVRAVRSPPAAVVLMAIFDTLGAAAETVSEIIARGLVPAALEMMDREITRAIEAYVHIGLPVDAAAILIAEIDGYAASLEDQASVIRGLCEAHGAKSVQLAHDQAERDRLWFARKSAAGAIAHLAPAYYLQDGTVPRSRLGELMAKVEEVGKTYGLSICNVFHAGDGNLHPLILFDPDDREQASKVVAASRDILVKCIEVGGNITGEHGVGVEKILEMGMQFTAGEIQVMREVKQLFDPADRCNPSKILPDLKVDPAEWAPRATAPAPVVDGTPAVGGFEPDACFAPGSTDEVAALLRNRQQDRAPIQVVGGGTKLRSARGEPLRGSALSMHRLRRVVEYAPQDLYVRVEAGMTFSQIQALAGRDGLWWPMVHPWPEATLGGIVASNWNGPARWRFGALRDLVLGGVVVLPDGRNVRIGGKVVKNVAGYDMTKLHVGALGSLGVLTELNLKLAALPAAQRALAATAPTAAQAVAAALRAFQASLVASSILVFGGDRSGLGLPSDAAATVVITAAGHPADVGEELRLMDGIVREASPPQAIESAGETAWAAWHRVPAGTDAVTLRLGLPNARIAEVVSHPALESAAFVADVTTGVTWVRWPSGVKPDAVAQVQGMACAAGGYALMLRAPAALSEAVDPWGHRPSLAPMMEALRRRWDPAGVLNPGRFAFA